MGITYKPGKLLFKFLEKNNFQMFTREPNSNTYYYSNFKIGKQVKIDFKKEIIILLDARGNSISRNRQYTELQLKQILKIKS